MPRLSSKRGRPSRYRLRLRSKEWDEVKAIVRLRDGHCCQRCGSGLMLEVHHLTYYVDGKSIVGREKEHLDKLITLCADCHRRAHDKA